MVVNDFYESISVDRTVSRLPPVPKIPIRTKDIRKVFFELSDDYKTLAMPNVTIERQPRRQTYFLELDDLLLCDYIVEFRNSNMPPLRRHYSSQMTLTDSAALAGLQHQSDIVAGYNRLKRTDYCALAQVIVHSDIWSEWRLTVIAATVRIALVDILDLSEVDIPAGGFLYPAVGWG